MWKWLRRGRLRAMPLEGLVDLIAGDRDPDAGDVLAERIGDPAPGDPAPVVALIEERLLRAAPEQAKRLLSTLKWIAPVDNSPAEQILRLVERYLGGETPEELRGEAIAVVCWLKDRAAAPCLLQVFGTECSEFDTSLIQQSLGRYKAREAIPRLVKNARIQKSEWIRGSACQALGEIGGEEALVALHDIFEHERSPRVRLEAAMALAGNGEDEVESYLESVFREGEPMAAADVTSYRIGRGDIRFLERALARMRAEGCPDRGWFTGLGNRFPQMPQQRWDVSRPSGRQRMRMLRWLEKHLGRFRWDSKKRHYVVPGLPLPH